MRYWIIAASLGAAVVTACATADMPDAAEGVTLYTENCAICHGPAGRGDGPLAADLRPRPGDLSLLASRAGGVFPRAEVLSAIDGYAKSDQLDEAMPEFGLLLRGDMVPVDVGDGIMTPVPRPLAALMFYLEEIQR